MGKIKKDTQKVLSKIWSNWNSHIFLLGVYICTTVLEKFGNSCIQQYE